MKSKKSLFRFLAGIFLYGSILVSMPAKSISPVKPLLPIPEKKQVEWQKKEGLYGGDYIHLTDAGYQVWTN